MPAAFRFAASHLLGKVSVMAEATLVSQSSALSSQVISSPTHAPALPKIVENLPEAFISQAESPDVSFLAATWDWQPRRPDSFLPTAFSFAPVHLSARAVPAPTTTSA